MNIIPGGGWDDNTLKVWEVKETKIKQTFEVNVPQARYSVYAVS